MSTPFQRKGRSERVRSATTRHRGDVGSERKSHPPQSPFLRKGEDKLALCERRGRIESVIASNDADRFP